MSTVDHVDVVADWVAAPVVGMAGVVVVASSDLSLEHAEKPTIAIAAKPAAASVLVETVVIALSLLCHGRRVPPFRSDMGYSE